MAALSRARKRRASTDAEGCLSFLSQRALAELGDEGDVLLGKALTQVFQDVDNDDSGTTQRSLAFKLKARSKLDEHVVAVADGRGSARWWRLNARPLTDARGTFQGYRGSAVDISAQYAYEARVTKQFQIDELSRASLTAGEQEELEAEKLRLNNVEKLSSLSTEAFATLYESEGSTTATLDRALQRVLKRDGHGGS